MEFASPSAPSAFPSARPLDGTVRTSYVGGRSGTSGRGRWTSERPCNPVQEGLGVNFIFELFHKKLFRQYWLFPGHTSFSFAFPSKLLLHQTIIPPNVVPLQKPIEPCSSVYQQAVQRNIGTVHHSTEWPFYKHWWLTHHFPILS